MKKLLAFLFFAGLGIGALAQNETQRNSIVVETNFIMMSQLSYDHFIPLKDNLSLMAGGGYIMGTGFGYGSHWVNVEAGVHAFGPRHFLEAGVQFISGINDDSSGGLKVAYRFQGKKGLTFKVTANAIFNIDPIFVPVFGIGYSF